MSELGSMCIIYEILFIFHSNAIHWIKLCMKYWATDVKKENVILPTKKKIPKFMVTSITRGFEIILMLKIHSQMSGASILRENGKVYPSYPNFGSSFSAKIFHLFISHFENFLKTKILYIQCRYLLRYQFAVRSLYWQRDNYSH